MVTAVVRVTILASFLSRLALASRCPISLALALAFAYVHSRMSRWAGSSAGFAFKYSCFYQHSASSLSDAPRPVPMSTKLALFSPLVPKSFLQLVFPCIWAFHLSSPFLLFPTRTTQNRQLCGFLRVLLSCIDLLLQCLSCYDTTLARHEALSCLLEQFCSGTLISVFPH